MEEKLYMAASKLPEPAGDFSCLEALAEKRGKRTGNKRRLVVLAAVLCLLITACAYSTTRYGLWGGYSSQSMTDAGRAAEQFSFLLPQTLKGSPFQSFSTAHGAPQGASYLRALLSPTYMLYSVHYYTERETIREDGSTYGWAENAVNVSFGTTEKAQWKYHFSVAEDGSCNYSGVEPGSNRTVEYRSYMLHLYTIGDSHSVRWEDPVRNMVIDVSCYDPENQGEAVEVARELIDLNLPEPEETLPQ